MEQDFHGNFQVNVTWFFAFFSSVLDWIVLILVWFAQVSGQSCPWPLKSMMSQVVEGTWIRMGHYEPLGQLGQRTCHCVISIIFVTVIVLSSFRFRIGNGWKTCHCSSFVSWPLIDLETLWVMRWALYLILQNLGFYLNAINCFLY